MKCFLVISIEYKFFQKPADITIHLGDNFIDTFQLDRDYAVTNVLPQIENQWYKKLGVDRHLTRENRVQEWAELPSFYKVYEMEDSAINGKLQIKVENSDSDYTNGFMRNSSMIRFPIISIVPKDLTENRGEKFMERLVKLDDAVEEHRKIGFTTSSPEYRWPCAELFQIERENEIYEESGLRNNKWWIGGSFTAKFDIKKWQDNKYIGPTGEREWARDPRNITAYDLFLASYIPLLNIYDEN